MNDDKKQLREKIDYLEKAIEDLEDTHDDLVDRLCNLESKIQDLDIINQILEEEISSYKAENSMLSKEIE